MDILINNLKEETYSKDNFSILSLLWIEIDYFSSILVAGSKSGSIYFFSVSTNETLFICSIELTKNDDWITSIDNYKHNLSENYLIFGTANGCVIQLSYMITEKNTIQEISRSIIYNEDMIRTVKVSFCPWNENIIAFCKGCKLYVYRISDKTLNEIIASNQYITGFSWIYESKSIITSSLEGEVNIYNIKNLNLLNSQNIFQPTLGIYGIAISPSGAHFASISK